MGDILRGNTSISNIYRGQDQVSKVYRGQTEVWSAGGGFIDATGGTITTDGDFRIHTFTSTGTFEVLSAPDGQTLDILVQGGGSSGWAFNNDGDGGAGGTANLHTGVTPTAGSSTITIGAGGSGFETGANNTGNAGNSSSGLGFTSTGGTTDGTNSNYIKPGSPTEADAGRGGAGSGANGILSIGGNGVNFITGTLYGGGGSGGRRNNNTPFNAPAGGGTGGNFTNNPGNGTTRGAGGGGSSYANRPGGNGFAGQVIIKYQFQ